MVKNLRLLGLGLLLVIIAFVVSNWQYFWQNAKYEVIADPKTELNQPDQVIPPSLPIGSPSTVQAPKFDQIGNLSISSLGVSVPIMQVYEVSERAFQAALIYGVVHYPTTAQIGSLGNPYIFGHSSDYVWSKGKFKTVFARLPKIELGAEIVVTNQDGQKFKYKVIEKKIVEKDDLSVLDQHNYEKKLLTLQTSYPVGTALKRFVAVCELVE
ncbi:MAG: hypothetical protein A3B10_02240 [Candidatus Doudnabacteria bacterium RIFCSPLOWO2_01_FULL_44_21]|uniref:Sortase n=1 Tax=Candidatus Doudnabacteria bacterium RIFCSPLOWO2_01_FULL_44_21 TaxID=1817841 RepID=A0A1F5Q5C6_9BACT|nr:MAG: hypothetical protein A3B95_01060 [Candidatus Doudnabacteria bacterium RIFCSPHIGHO2_02_FULL_43_13b]OGE97391.1 MAG: hypothetical protein A3B10_02240 [Candidatus Doudnabacteria bacterium RIFCSPLOWO2_01_FULL_44_21]